MPEAPSHFAQANNVSARDGGPTDCFFSSVLWPKKVHTPITPTADNDDDDTMHNATPKSAKKG